MPRPVRRIAAARLRSSVRTEAKLILQELEVGFPIRRSTGQRVFAPHRRFSQRITSFFACACQGIHQLPLFHLITLIANAHLFSEHEPCPKSLATLWGHVPDAIGTKDQLLETCPGVRLGLPTICPGLSGQGGEPQSSTPGPSPHKRYGRSCQ